MSPELSAQNIAIPWYFVLFFGLAILAVFLFRIARQYFSQDTSLPSELLPYISRMRSEGYSLSEIKKRLIEAQWSLDIVEKALASRPEDASFQESLRQEILLLGLSFAFFGNAVIAFLLPDQFQRFLETSFLLPSFLSASPYLPVLVGLHNAIIALLFAAALYPKIVGWWASVWITLAIAVIFSQEANPTLSILLDVTAHGAVLAVALFFALCTPPSSA